MIRKEDLKRGDYITVATEPVMKDPSNPVKIFIKGTVLKITDPTLILRSTKHKLPTIQCVSPDETIYTIAEITEDSFHLFRRSTRLEIFLVEI